MSAEYFIQEIRSGIVVTEATDNDASEAIATAKQWKRHPINDGDETRVLCDGEIVWPHPLRCDKCGSRLLSHGAACLHCPEAR